MKVLLDIFISSHSVDLWGHVNTLHHNAAEIQCCFVLNLERVPVRQIQNTRSDPHRWWWSVFIGSTSLSLVFST